jgi:hypothetical protein
MKPSYLVIGASKCGTSSLCELLGMHPDVFMSSPKEPNFFCYDEVYARGWEWYESLFDGAEGATAIGEGTSQYSQRNVWPKAADRIAHHLPDARLIYMVRHPLRRMESLWVQMLEHRRPIPFEFTAALRADRPRLIDSSNYLRELEVFERRFPADRILVQFFEDFHEDPGAVLERCYRFLGVDPTFRPADADRPRNRSVGKKVEPRWLKALRRRSGYRAVSGLIPGPLKRWARERVRVRCRAKPSWDADTLRWVLAQIGPDTRRFLRRQGRSEDFWPLEAELEAMEGRAPELPGERV